MLHPRKGRLLLLFLLVPVTTAYGYVDPGSGMLLIQGLLALIGGLVYFVKNPVRAMREWLARLRERLRK